jgi:hypothetical protein
MKSPSNSLGLVHLIRREAKAALRMTPWVFASLLLAALLWYPDLAATGGLFQSPQATPTPTLTLTPTATQEVPPSATPETQPSATLTSEAPESTATETAVPSASPPTQTPGAAVTATLVPTNPPTATPVPTETPVVPTQTPVPQTATATPAPADQDENERYAQEDSNILFDWTMLFDSVALGLSYVWLCCGVLILLGVPVFFVILWLSARRREQGDA